MLKMQIIRPQTPEIQIQLVRNEAQEHGCSLNICDVGAVVQDLPGEML